MNRSVCVERRFNGPLGSGNGGYSAGLIADFVEGTVEVNLRAPVPLDVTLEVSEQAGGGIDVMDEGTPIADARPVSGIELEVPAPVSPDEARIASASYEGVPGGTFGSCFVCGLAREDSLGVFAGPVADRRLVASAWTPPEWTADAEGNVLPEFVWAVLDCPTYRGLYMGEEDPPLSKLARFTARIDGPVVAGNEHVAIGWPIEIDGRKHHAGSALYSGDGKLLAVARALLIGPREERA